MLYDFSNRILTHEICLYCHSAIWCIIVDDNHLTYYIIGAQLTVRFSGLIKTSEWIWCILSERGKGNLLTLKLVYARSVLHSTLTALLFLSAPFQKNNRVTASCGVTRRWLSKCLKLREKSGKHSQERHFQTGCGASRTLWAPWDSLIN